MKYINRSLVLEFIRLCIVAFLASILFMLVANEVASFFVESLKTDEREDYLKDQSILSMQKFVDENKISTKTISKLSTWSDENGNVIFKVYYNDELLFDSIYGNASNSDFPYDKISYSNKPYYKVKLMDTNIKVFIKYYDYYFENKAIDIINVISIILFFIIMIRGIHIKIKNIVKLNENINQTIQDMQIAVESTGNDEIYQVASNVELLRKTILEKMALEKQARAANMELVTNLSHDIRTPLTSIIGYLELVKDRDLGDPVNKYVDISLDKSLYLKTLLNELFEYFLIHSKERKISFEEVDTNELLYQMFEEYLIELEERGTTIVRDFQDITSTMKVNINLFHRVIDNLFSNIDKYADLKKPIYIKWEIEDEKLKIHMENYVRPRIVKTNSTHIGITNSKAIMEIHYGKLEFELDDQVYVVEISMPVKRES